MQNNMPASPMMSFGEAVKTCFSKYANFNGRARRSEFWWFYLLLWIVNAVLGGILNYFATAKAALVAQADFSDLSALEALAEKEESYANINLILMVVFGVWTLATLLPMLAAWARRLHDVGKSGHLLWLCLLCGVGGLIPLIMAIPEGNPGPNQYGPSPKFPAAPNQFGGPAPAAAPAPNGQAPM